MGSQHTSSPAPLPQTPLQQAPLSEQCAPVGMQQMPLSSQ
jgi:hypothetical protein